MPLRPEALPLEWKRLTESQQEAFSRIVGWLADAVDELDPLSAARKGRLDALRPRTSGVCLVSGERGTGKTSLLLTLKDTCRARQSLTADVSQGLAHMLDKVKTGVVWLEPLDMNALPGPTNLLAAILARVRQSLDAGGTSRSAPRGLLESTGKREAARNKLQQTQTRIARAWRRRLPDSLDGENYAVEVTDMEDTRLEVNRRLEEVLDALAENEAWDGEVKNPLFVLPVDDVDLNPFRCLDLLQLLRMITTPRLFALVLGDAEVAETVTKIRLSGQYARLARGASQEHFVSIPSDEVAAIVGSTAAKIIRKVLPPSQRAHLRAMTIEQALAYEPDPVVSGAEESNLHKEDRTLRSVMERISLEKWLHEPIDRRPWNLQPAAALTRFSLADFLIGPGAPKTGSIGEYPYGAARLLQAPARRVADLWLLLDSIMRSVEGGDSSPLGEKLLKTLIDLLLGLIQEEQQLSPDERHEVLEGFQSDASGRLVFQTDVFGIRREFGTERTLATKWCAARIHKIARWRLGQPRAPGRPGDPPKAPAFLEDGTAAAVMLVHDLAAMGTEGTLLGSPIASTVKSTGWVVAEWNLGTVTVPVPWPEPDWVTFRAFDQFAERWRHALQVAPSLTDHEHAAQFYGYTFLSCVLDMVGRDAEPSTHLQQPPTEKHWDALATRLEGLLKRPELQRTLPLTFACALAPEAAPFLQKDADSGKRRAGEVVQKFVEPLRKHWDDAACARAIRSARLARVNPFYASGVPGGPLAHLLVAPHTFEQKVRSEFSRAGRLLEQVQPGVDSRARMGRLPAPSATGEAWPTAIQKLLAAIQEATERARPHGSRPSSLQRTTWESEIPPIVAFLREAVEGLERTLAMSKAHPINTVCNGTLCPWQADLDRLEAGTTPPT